MQYHLEVINVTQPAIQSDSSLTKLGYIAITAIAIPILLTIFRRWYDSTVKIKEIRRKLYAEIFATCMSYKEFPYVIYRRDYSKPEDERNRISTLLMDIQKNLAYYKAWLEIESPDIARAYAQLFSMLRKVAGSEMKKSWRRGPIKTDEEMVVVPKIDLSMIEPYEKAYIEMVKYQLSPFISRLFIEKPNLVDLPEDYL